MVVCSIEAGGAPTSSNERFRLAAGDRPGIKELWHAHTSSVIAQLEEYGLASFEDAQERLESTLWPDTLAAVPGSDGTVKRHRPHGHAAANSSSRPDSTNMVFPLLKRPVDKNKVKIKYDRWRDSNIALSFPDIVVTDKVHAHVICGDGTTQKHEIELPKKSELQSHSRRRRRPGGQLSRPEMGRAFLLGQRSIQKYPSDHGFRNENSQMATLMADGSVFFWQANCSPRRQETARIGKLFRDGERFWRYTNDYDHTSGDWVVKVREVDPQTGKISSRKCSAMV